MRIHTHIDILEAIRWGDDQLSIFTKEDGLQATPEEAKEFLKEELLKGRRYMACGGCDNRKPDGRCAGHEDTLDSSAEGDHLKKENLR